MNIKLKTIAACLLPVLLVACNGKDGSNGTNGANGSNGMDGAGQVITLSLEGRSAAQGGFNVSGAEIVSFEKKSGRIFTINAQSGKVDVYNANNATAIAAISAPVQSVDLGAMLLTQKIVADKALVGGANSITSYGDLVAVAVEANPKTNAGWVVFLNSNTLEFVKAVNVGSQPDMLVFTPDGKKVLVANEGEADVGYINNPEGSVSIINVADYAVSSIGFTDFNDGGSRAAELPKSKMALGGMDAGATAAVAKDLEPEYISVRSDSKEAYVSLQEANAIAVIDLEATKVSKIMGLGFKDHAIPGNEIDASQQDGVNLKNWPIYGMYQPDSIASYTFNGKTYLVTANEGDSREDWLNGVTNQAACEGAGYYFSGGKCREELALKDASKDANAFFTSLSTELSGLISDTSLARLKFSHHATKQKNGATITRLYAYGARSFAIWDVQAGERVYDSGHDFEKITANRYGSLFNQDHNGSATGDKRSNSKGPEPEGMAIGKINGHTYAFVGLERMGGIMVYDISNPNAPTFVQYMNNRDVTRAADAAAVAAGTDLGPEGFYFINGADTADGKPRLVVGNEVSGTTSVYSININSLR